MEFTLSKSLVKSTNNYRYFFNTFFIFPKSNNNTLIIRKNSSNLTFTSHTPQITCTFKLSNPTSFFRFNFPNLKPILPSFNFNPFSKITASLDHIAEVFVGNDKNPIEWHLTSSDTELGYGSNDKKLVVVLLGWLGCDHEIQLRQYADLYNMLGVNAVTFATSVNDVLDFVPRVDNVKARLEVLVDEMVEWMQYQNEEECFLVFHTFSNIGWLAYGALLNILQGKEEILNKIKGCVVDSGGVPEFDPKIWAAEITTTVLTMFAESGKKQNGNDEELMLFEAESASQFEEIITQALESPDGDFDSILRRLTEVTSTLSENQPSHPQLYLYSTADKVIPFQKIESFAEHQKKLGKKVTTFNFESSPHLDHYRAFPDMYRSLIQNFLKDCVAVEGRQLYKLLMLKAANWFS
uniref:transmembrane protein 53-A-like n=1 Tax=Erigeron canadensis TaxID=72917 RepID=UPI001CB904A1|nr:transmembrane protein 53-A-like [Erigeron canadensis]